MGRGGRGRRSRSGSAGGGGGGGGSRSGISSAGHGLSRSQQQEHLVRNFPNPAAASILSNSHHSYASGSHDDDYPYEDCEKTLNRVYDAIRLCGSDCVSVYSDMPFLQRVCGIDVQPDRLEKKATDAAAAAHR